MGTLIVLALCLDLLGAGSSSSVHAEPAQPSRDTQALVRSLEARYHSAATLKATFLERYREGGRDVRVESGTVYFRRPGRMRWEYESPEKKLFVADGKTVWFYVPADHTVSRAPMKESADWRTPLALLTRKTRLSRLCGRIEPADASSSAGLSSGHALLRCTPRGPAHGRPNQGAVPAPERGESFQEVLFEVDEARSDLVRVLIRQAGGIEIEYRFGNWQENLPLGETLFHFQAPPGVAIVDEASIGGPVR